MARREKYLAKQRQAEWDYYFEGLTPEEFIETIEPLSDMAQKILKLRHLEGKQFKEIAPLVGYAPSTVRVIANEAWRLVDLIRQAKHLGKLRRRVSR